MKKILYVNGGKKAFGIRFQDACLKHNVECISFRTATEMFFETSDEGVFLHVKNNKIDLKEIGYAFIRVKGKHTQATSLLTILLELCNVPFNDASNSEHNESNEKITQMLKFAHSGIPIPQTTIFSHDSFFAFEETISKRYSFPLVLKVNGSKGNAVWKINDREQLKKKVDEVGINNRLLMIQEYLKNTHDIRALYFEKNLIAAIERHSGDGFYNNVAKGGKTVVTNVTPNEDIICKKALSVLNIDFGGIDFLRTENGPVFFEINTGPQVYGLEEATKINVPLKLVQTIKEKYLG